MEFYLNDFSAGLVTKNVYGRTDLDIKNKGLKDIKGAIPNMFGNITNFDFDLNKINELNLNENTMINIRNNNFLLVNRENESLMYVIEYRDPVLDLNAIVLVEINLITFTKRDCVINVYGYPRKLTISSYIKSTDSLLIIGDITFTVNIEKFRLGNPMDASDYQSLVKLRPAKSNLFTLDKFKLDTETALITSLTYSYDPRNNYATIKFKKKNFSTDSTELDLPSSKLRGCELEISFGKFQYLGDGDKWYVIKSPIKDTLKIASDGTITVEEKSMIPIDVMYRELYDYSFFRNLEDAFICSNRMCFIKSGKLFMSKIGTYNDLSNVENSDSEGVIIDLPFEKHIKTCVFDDLIFFSNRGIFNTSGFITPTNTNVKFVSSVVASENFPLAILYNGINFVNRDLDEVYNIGFNGETQMYECSRISATIDLKNITNMDMITSNDKTNESLLITDENRTYLFNYNVIEQIKFWTSFDKKEFLFSFFNDYGNLEYFSLSKTNSNLVEKNSINFINKGFNINLFKPDANKGQVKPFFFDRNKIVKEIEILYNGTGIISIKDELGIKKPILDKRLGIGTFHRNFSGELEILKSPVNWQWGNEMILEIETTEEFTIYAINLKFE